MREAPSRPRRATHVLVRNAALHCTTATKAGCSLMALLLRAPRTCWMWELGIRTPQQQLASMCPLRLAPSSTRGRPAGAESSQRAGSTLRPWGHSQLRRAFPIPPHRPHTCHKRTAADLLRCAQEAREALALDRSQARDAGVRQEARVALIKLRALVSAQALYTTRLQARRPVTCHTTSPVSASVCQRGLGLVCSSRPGVYATVLLHTYVRSAEQRCKHTPDA